MLDLKFTPEIEILAAGDVPQLLVYRRAELSGFGFWNTQVKRAIFMRIGWAYDIILEL